MKLTELIPIPTNLTPIAEESPVGSEDKEMEDFFGFPSQKDPPKSKLEEFIEDTEKQIPKKRGRPEKKQYPDILVHRRPVIKDSERLPYAPPENLDDHTEPTPEVAGTQTPALSRNDSGLSEVFGWDNSEMPSTNNPLRDFIEKEEADLNSPPVDYEVLACNLKEKEHPRHAWDFERWQLDNEDSDEYDAEDLQVPSEVDSNESINSELGDIDNLLAVNQDSEKEDFALKIQRWWRQLKNKFKTPVSTANTSLVTVIENDALDKTPNQSLKSMDWDSFNDDESPSFVAKAADGLDDIFCDFNLFSDSSGDSSDDVFVQDKPAPKTSSPLKAGPVPVMSTSSSNASDVEHFSKIAAARKRSDSIGKNLIGDLSSQQVVSCSSAPGELQLRERPRIDYKVLNDTGAHVPLEQEPNWRKRKKKRKKSKQL